MSWSYILYWLNSMCKYVNLLYLTILGNSLLFAKPHEQFIPTLKYVSTFYKMSFHMNCCNDALFVIHRYKESMGMWWGCFLEQESTFLWQPPLRVMRRSSPAASTSPRAKTTSSWCHGWEQVSLPALATSGTQGGRCWLQLSISGDDINFLMW